MNMKAITRINRRADNRTERLSLLTGCERQIMNLVSEGLSNKEIARKVKLTDGTIKVHLHHVIAGKHRY